MEIHAEPLKELIVEAVMSLRDYNRDKKLELRKALSPSKPEYELLKAIETHDNMIPKCNVIIRVFQENQRVVINDPVVVDRIVEALNYYASELKKEESMSNGSKLMKIEMLKKDMVFKLERMAS